MDNNPEFMDDPEDQLQREEAVNEETPVDEERVDWEDPSTEVPEAEDGFKGGGVQVGLSQLGPMIQVTSPDGTIAQKVISIDECFLLAGQLTAMGTFVQHMAMQQQMAEQARIQQMMQEGLGNEKKSKGGVYLS